MSTQGIILLDLLGIGLLTLILNLVRIKKLAIGYAVIWLLSIGAMIITISLPPLLFFVTRVVGATFPASALSLLAFFLVFVMLIFFSMQLSILSARQIELIQRIALDELAAEKTQMEEDAQNES